MERGRASRHFVEAFNLVHQAFRTPPAEIEEARALARADMAAAEDGYLPLANLLRAGWKPVEDRPAWPSLDLRAAA